MPSPINVDLRGYLDFFGLKNGGSNPQMPAAVLAPTMDLQRWYMESRAQVYTFSRQNFFVASGGGNFIPIIATTPTDISDGTDVICPQNEIWLLMPGSRIFAGFSADAGSEVELTLVTANQSSDQFEFIPMNPREGYGTSDAAITRSQCRTLSEPFWIQPGWTLTGLDYGHTVAAGGDIDIGGTLKLLRLRI